MAKNYQSKSKNTVDLAIMKQATQISMQIMKELRDAIKVGVTGGDINRLTGDLCVKYDVLPAFKGVAGPKGPFPANLCLCVNDEVLHAIPSDKRVFASGDLITIDFGIVHKGHYTDHCITVGLGEVSPEDRKLLQIGKLAVETAAKLARPGARSGDLGAALHGIVKLAGFEVVREYVGHGIGQSLHLAPELPAYGRPGSGDLLKKDMVVCVEAQILAGGQKIYTDSDGWTIKTRDGSKAVMFEFMMQVADKPVFLTDTREWPLFV